jgi:hypothetical protein
MIGVKRYMLFLGVLLALNLQAHETLFTADLSKFVNAVKEIDTWKLLLPFIFIGVIVLWQVIERVLMEKCPHCKYRVGRPSKSEFAERKFSDANCPNCGGDLNAK